MDLDELGKRYPEVRAANAAGHVELGGKLAVVAPINALGWWYVVVADEARLLRQGAARHPGGVTATAGSSARRASPHAASRARRDRARRPR